MFSPSRSTPEKYPAILPAKCGEPMVMTGQAAKIFGIKQPFIFQIIKNEAAHFPETEADAVIICRTTLAEVLDGERRKHQIPSAYKATDTG